MNSQKILNLMQMLLNSLIPWETSKRSKRMNFSIFNHSLERSTGNHSQRKTKRGLKLSARWIKRLTRLRKSKRKNPRSRRISLIKVLLRQNQNPRSRPRRRKKMKNKRMILSLTLRNLPKKKSKKLKRWCLILKTAKKQSLKSSRNVRLRKVKKIARLSLRINPHRKRSKQLSSTLTSKNYAYQLLNKKKRRPSSKLRIS